MSFLNIVGELPSKSRLAAFAASALSLAIVASALAPAAVAADKDQITIDSVSAAGGVYRATNGESVKVLKVVEDVAERIITGKTHSGEPVQIVVQSVPVDPGKTKRLREDAARPVAAENLGYSETPLTSQSGTIQAAPLDETKGHWRVVAAHAATTTTASFSWPAVNSFSAFMDDQLIGKSDRGGELQIRDLRPGTEYVVTLVEDTTERKQSVRTTTITTFSDSAAVNQDRLIAPMTYQPYNTAYVHKTFIPDYRVPGSQCNYGVPGWEFGGDNRTYTTPTVETPFDAANYRTMMFVNINWDNPSPYDLFFARYVGATQIFHNGQLTNTLYANMDDMKFQEAQAGSSYASVYFSHASSNPGCKFFDASYSGSISYGEWVEFYRSGTVSVDGYRLAAPAHEMYARFTSSTGGNVPWKTISRRANQGFQCLLGNLFCPLDFYNVSTSY